MSNEEKKFFVSHTYICIDLKSFYASVECAERGLDPMTTDLVVADPSRDKGTICLAVSPSLKEKGVKNRCRVYEIPEHLTYIMAPPRMQLYLDYSAKIYGIYLKYIAKEDIHVYSIDEAFMDVTKYMELYQMSAREIGIMIMNDIQNSLGITATCGIGTNLYLTKIALDITAKHAPDRIGFLDEQTYQETLWHHRPLTDFWRIGSGTQKRLASIGIHDMYGIAHADEKYIYKLFGIDSDILIDHAWGREPTTIADIKQYSSKTHSVSSGQVLLRDYSFEEALIIVKEMTDLVCLELFDKQLITESITLYIGYSKDVCPATKGTVRFHTATNSPDVIAPALVRFYMQNVNRSIPVRRVCINCNKVISESYQQFDLFSDPVKKEKEQNMQRTVLKLRTKYGNTAVMKGLNLLEAGTTQDRLHQIGGHRSGT